MSNQGCFTWSAGSWFFDIYSPLAGGHCLRGKDGDSSRETLMPGRENALFGDVQSARLNSFLPSVRWPEDLSMTISIIPMPFEN